MGDVRVEHVPGEVLGLLPRRRLFQEAVRERARRRRWLDKFPEKRGAASRLQLGESLSLGDYHHRPQKYCSAESIFLVNVRVILTLFCSVYLKKKYMTPIFCR